MSVTTEILLEQIRKTEFELETARSSGNRTAVLDLQNRLQELYLQFNTSTSALNEGKSILKG